MWGTTLVLLLWAADKNLLTRLWAFLASALNKLAWSALTLYSNWKSTNDMIKDGYHVDEAYLYELTGTKKKTKVLTQQTFHRYNNGNAREIDVLRIFRQHIQLQTFTHSKRISLPDFIGMCCEPNSNFTEYDKTLRYELVVSYTFDHKHYKIVYGNSEEEIGTGATTFIRFPIYTEQTIRNKDMKKNGAITAGMITANEDADDGIDIYPQLRILAGPMENFYADTEFSIKRNHLYYTGLRVATTSMYIKMIDVWGTEFSVRPEQQTIKLEK